MAWKRRSAYSKFEHISEKVLLQEQEHVFNSKLNKPETQLWPFQFCPCPGNQPHISANGEKEWRKVTSHKSMFIPQITTTQ
jgi:hypothetical protein